MTLQFLILCLLLPTLHADEPGKKERTAETIVQEWDFKRDRKGKAGRSSGWSAGPAGSTKLYAKTGLTTSGTYEDAWNFYAAKCGTDLKYKPNHIYVGGKKVQGGEYVVIDQTTASALFTFRTEDYTVCVTVSEGKEKEVMYTLTVSLK